MPLTSTARFVFEMDSGLRRNDDSL